MDTSGIPTDTKSPLQDHTPEIRYIGKSLLKGIS